MPTKGNVVKNNKPRFFYGLNHEFMTNQSARRVLDCHVCRQARRNDLSYLFKNH